MLDVLYNDIKNSGRTEGRKNEQTDERKKSHIEVAAPPKNECSKPMESKRIYYCLKDLKI